ncbi:hypothetical protein HC928_07970, partial [bacterium]|nr:hypothetical protein [bacterium]
MAARGPGNRALARRFDGLLMHSVLQENDDYIAELHSRIAREAGVSLNSIDFEALDAAAEEEADPDDEATATLLPIRQQVIQAMVKDVEERLERYSFINFHSISDYGPYFAYHSLVRDQIEAALREDRGADYLLGLHQRIVDYYQQVLKGYEEQGAADNVYVQCYRYEDPIWQSRMSEWLYHLACVMDLTADDDPETEARRHAVQFGFLNVYMSAWQWWGWYLDFPFNNQVLNGWKSILLDEGDPVYTLVARFHEIYPHGFFNEKIGSPHWDEVQAILESLIERFDLHMERDFDPETEEDALWLTMQVMEFYASCFRFRRPDPDYARAEAIYRRSIALSDVANDPFNKTYYHAFLADMYIEIGRFADAVPEAEIVIDMVGDYREIDSDQDYEVMSMAHLALGHVAYEQARWDDAASAYLAAIASSYLSNFLPLGIPTGPLHGAVGEGHRRLSEQPFAGGLAGRAAGTQCSDPAPGERRCRAS